MSIFLKLRTLRIYVCLMLLFVVQAKAENKTQPLDATTWKQYQKAIEPTEKEAAFLNIGWFSQLGKAVNEAHQSKKPLLIYVMNGHPLGCT